RVHEFRQGVGLIGEGEIVADLAKAVAGEVESDGAQASLGEIGKIAAEYIGRRAERRAMHEEHRRARAFLEIADLQSLDGDVFIRGHRGEMRIHASSLRAQAASLANSYIYRRPRESGGPGKHRVVTGSRSRACRRARERR